MVYGYLEWRIKLKVVKSEIERERQETKQSTEKKQQKTENRKMWEPTADAIGYINVTQKIINRERSLK